MAEISHISWTDATYNPWWGCTKVSAACDNCYAERDSKRYGFSIWGKDSDRRFFGDKHWAEPVKWNTKAEKDGGPPLYVFCASMADVFEDRRDLDPVRDRLWELIEGTPHLRWLLLTKRPHLMTRLTPDRWNEAWPDNAWAGTTVEDQTWTDARLPWLRRVPSRVRFVSAEPLVGEVRLNAHIDDLQWVITGGESGGGARAVHADWFRSLRTICDRTDTPYHFKQWGEWKHESQWSENFPIKEVFRGQRFIHEDGTQSLRVGRKEAGRQLDGLIWDARPE